MWLYIPGQPSTSCPSAPEAADSTSASNWQSQALAQSAWWRGKPSDARAWSRRCKTASWLRLLCGAMPEPSAAGHGAASWMASLAASRASLTAWPAESVDSTMSATSGAPLAASSPRPGPGSSSSRTSPACSRRGLTKSLAPSGYDETFASWAMRLREDCSRRRRSARLTSASGSSSSGWPSPDASVFNDGQSPAAERERAKGYNGNGGGTPLAMAATLWPTPDTSQQTLCSATSKSQGDGKLQVSLADAAREYWSTPLGGHHGPDMVRRDTGAPQSNLETALALWRTPQAMDAERGGNGTWTPKPRAGQHSIRHQAAVWSTPSVADVIGGRTSRSGDRKDEALLNTQAKACSLPGPETAPPGSPSSQTDPTSPRLQLNPRFVEWLMGWPPGWTNFGCSETALSLWKQRSRSALSQLASHDAPPAQASLFG